MSSAGRHFLVATYRRSRHIPATTLQVMSSSNATSSAASFPVKEAITTKLTEALAPTHLEVRNESHMHKVPANSETHFKVIVVSPAFASAKTPLARHRMVNSVLAEEVASDGPVHALSIVAKTPEQWDAMVTEGKAEVGPSPNCRGGDGSLPKKGEIS